LLNLIRCRLLSRQWGLTAMRLRLPVALALLFGLAGALWADPAGRVARLNFLSGSVTFRPATLDDWAPASVNYPMSTGDHLWTDRDGRAEVHVGSTVFRLGPQTAFEFLNLDDRTVQVRLAQGSLSVHPRRLPEDQILEVDTPNSAVSIDRPGVYRVNVSEGKSSVTVRHGAAELTAAGQAFPIHAREEAFVEGSDSPTYDVREAGPEDPFDLWSRERDRREDNLVSTRYVSSEVVGAEDLDSYGHWREVGDYGPVWVPASVEVGWAPYHNGHWAWVAPWGWTWVDDAPWGFAPFHYGRWVYVGGFWAWSPGTIVARPVYAPALVAFVAGGGWSASLTFGGGGGVRGGIGAVAWFPLGPREAYVPPYPVSPAYVQQVNVTHVTNINVNNFTVNNGVVTSANIQTTAYVNQSAPGAITAVPQNAFVGARPVASVAAVVPATAIGTASITSGAPAGIQAQPVSVLGHAPGSVTNVAAPPTAVINRPYVAKVAPPAAPKVFSPTLAAVTTNVPPKPASQATNIPLLHPAVPVGGGKGLTPANANIVQPRVVSATETHAQRGVRNQPQGFRGGTAGAAGTGNLPPNSKAGAVGAGNQAQGVQGGKPAGAGTGSQPLSGGGVGGKSPTAGAGNKPQGIQGGSPTVPEDARKQPGSPANASGTPPPKPAPRPAPHPASEHHSSGGATAHPNPNPHEGAKNAPQHPHEAKPTPKPSPPP